MTRQATILLVEDERSILEGMADLLQIYDLSYEINVLKAANGEDGLAMMARSTPDLIISDIMMPRLNGFEFLAAVRTNSAWVHIPFIFLTAKGKKEDILEGRRSGAELYVTKPFVSEELLELVKTQLDRTFQLQLVRTQRLDNLKRNILQLLNHEFRTPLTYVTAYYEMLADSLVSFKDSKHLQEYLRGIQAGSRRLMNLVEDLVTIMEIRTGEAAQTYQHEVQVITDPGKLVQKRIDLIRPIATQEGVSLSSTIEDAIPSILGAPSQLSDVVDRLLDNALKFTRVKKQGPQQVQVEVASRNNQVCVAVKDTGIGFPAHVRGQIFDLFFQHNRQLLEQQGSGAGLAIVRGLIDLHDGTIEVESEEQVGSIFTVALPICGPDNDVPSSAGRSASRRATVLVVEDDLHLLEGLKDLLEFSDEPYNITAYTAHNGEEGLALLNRHLPDLIISDVMMPTMDGYEFLRQVRENSTWIHIPFIFLTARGEREDIHRGRRSGAEEYITKPYDIDELLDLTYTQLDRHFQRQGAFTQSFEALKKSILAMLQPDIKGPLDLVTSYTEKLAGDLKVVQTEQELISTLQVIQGGSQRLTRLIEDFIAMAEYKTGEARVAFELQAKPVDQIGVILYEAAYEKQVEATAAGVRFTYDLDYETPRVFCDRQRMIRGIERLLDVLLPLKQSCEQPEIHFYCQQELAMVDLCIEGTGIAFPPPAVIQIQSSLEQNDDSILELPEYGPGLAVVQNVVALHQGTLELEQSDPLKLLVKISLPIYQPIKADPV